MISENIRLILILTGALTTAATIGFFLSPRNLIRRVFHWEEISPRLLLVTMFSGMVGALVGALMIYAAFDPRLRVPAVVVAILEKVIFAGAVFLSPLKKYGLVKWAAIGDSFMALLYVGYLFGF